MVAPLIGRIRPMDSARVSGSQIALCTHSGGWAACSSISMPGTMMWPTEKMVK